MRVLNIKIDTNTRNVISMTTDFLGMENDNLQTKLVVELTDDLPGGGRIDFEIGDEKQYAMMTKVDNKYELMLTNSMLSSSLSAIQLVISWTESDHTLTWKSKILDLHIEPSINADGEVPEEFESWLEVLQTAVNEANNLDIEYEDGTITITHKDGTQSSVDLTFKKYDPQVNTFQELKSWIDNRFFVYTYHNYIYYSFNNRAQSGGYTVYYFTSLYSKNSYTVQFRFQNNQLAQTVDSDIVLLTSSDLNNYYDSDTVDTLLDTKVDKVVGKGLSTNDYTNDDIRKVGMIIYDDTYYVTGFESENNIFYTDGNNIFTRYHSIHLDDLENIAHINDSENYQNIQYITTNEIQSQGKITLCDELVSKPQSAELDYDGITLKEYGVTQKTIDYDDIVTNADLASALNSKQDKIDSTHKLPYSNISGTPTIPTNVSDLSNDSGYLTLATLPIFNGGVE